MNAEKEIPLCTVMPSVTPVCFGTMYTGAQPAVHGIQKYEKPVIVSHSVKSSMSIIFQERDMDYYICERVDEAAAVAAELIIKDEHDVIIFYNGNYDFKMHKFGPESKEALAELRCNARAFDQVNWLVKKHWSKHNTLVGFAMDHGCHEIDGNCGSHGLDMEEDLNILHLYQGYRREA